MRSRPALTGTAAEGPAIIPEKVVDDGTLAGNRLRRGQGHRNGALVQHKPEHPPVHDHPNSPHHTELQERVQVSGKRQFRTDTFLMPYPTDLAASLGRRRSAVTAVNNPVGGYAVGVV